MGNFYTPEENMCNIKLVALACAGRWRERFGGGRFNHRNIKQLARLDIDERIELLNCASVMASEILMLCDVELTLEPDMRPTRQKNRGG
jgi:hypothetical protein